MANPGFFGRNIRWLLPLLILLIAICLFMAMVILRQPPPQKPPRESVPVVEVAPVQLESLQLRVNSPGLVNPKYTTNLVAQVSGELVSISETFVRGGFVQKGQVLAQIDPTNYEVAVQNARANLASAEAAFEQEQAQGEVARVEWENVNDRPAPDLGLRKPQLAQAEARVTASRAALKQAQKDLERTRIRAPYDALVAERNVSLGTFVNTGSMIGRVLDTSVAEIRLPVANSELQYLVGDGVGSDVHLHGEVNGQQHTWIAPVVRSEGVVDETSRMRYLVAQVNDPYGRSGEQTSGTPVLSFGSYVTAEILGREIEQGVRIPRYLVNEGKVALYREGKLHLASLDVLRHTEGDTIVSGGLDEGDQLVLSSLEFPVEGMKLELAESEEQLTDSPAGEAVEGEQ